ncbi:AAA family ATPase [Flavobacterium lacisediminis]|uniref:AAA family ATPase n=1 Tax=Flavobacterium lacisediminis TaxID=2989705 RepID=A0ABT3EHK3_9FLAO|nr:AAA family ATPase [Flavobacterium lacisediminis]MCW1148047.1 AAA family ATPase [Flavobacterium lacisediminis]
MQIIGVTYSQFKHTENFWNLNPISFEGINLLVGKNASGKSKTLSLINGLANNLAENKPLNFTEGDFDFTFQKDDITYQFLLTVHEGNITSEILKSGSKTLIERDQNGKGKILSYKGDYHEFEIPTNELKINRRDKINYPYLEDINFWAIHTRIFQFSDSSTKTVLGLKDPNLKESEFNIKDTRGTIPTFNKGLKTYGKEFLDKIITDFTSIGFPITDIDLGPLSGFTISIAENPNAIITGVRVKEKDLPCWTDQLGMSNGMFRALSIIIHFNYYELEKIPGLILIDDVGEGLDFERSTNLIDLLISKAEKNPNMQLIMSTNDSFVMNSVDLKYWQIIDREGNQVKYYNHKNSPDTFGNYSLTGLNHFDFFASGFFKNGFSEE